jgi:hypothetical protein
MDFVLEKSKRFDFPNTQSAFGGRGWENLRRGILTTKRLSVVSVCFAEQSLCLKDFWHGFHGLHRWILSATPKYFGFADTSSAGGGGEEFRSDRILCA